MTLLLNLGQFNHPGFQFLSYLLHRCFASRFRPSHYKADILTAFRLRSIMFPALWLIISWVSCRVPPYRASNNNCNDPYKIINDWVIKCSKDLAGQALRTEFVASLITSSPCAAYRHPITIIIICLLLPFQLMVVFYLVWCMPFIALVIARIFGRTYICK